MSWRSVFWLNVPVGLAALVMVHIAKPDNSRQAGVTIRMGDVTLLVAGLALTVLAIQQATRWSWTSPATLGVLGVGVLLTTWFVLVQLHKSSPLVDVRLFARRAFLANLVVLGLVQFGMLAVVLYSALYLQELLHLSPMMAGLGVLPLILPITVAAQLGGRWYDRAGVRSPVLTGLALALVGLAVWTVPCLS